MGDRAAPAADEEDTKISRQEGYEESGLGYALYLLAAAASLGIALLVGYWFPVWRLRVRCRRTRSLRHAQYVLVVHSFGEVICPVLVARPAEGDFAVAVEPRGAGVPDDGTLFIEFQSRRMHYDADLRQFVRTEFGTGQRFDELRGRMSTGGLSAAQARRTRQAFGANRLEIPRATIPQLLVTEILHPFFVFQILSVILWFLEDYHVYAAAILFTSVVSVVVSLRQTMRNLERLREMADRHTDVQLVRDGRVVTLSSYAVVPGDRLVITDGLCMPCDAILINGECVVDESALTGESVAVIKASLPAASDHPYHAVHDRKFTLLAGTTVVQQRYYRNEPVTAWVTKVGFATLKGELVASIMHPRPNKFRFYEDSFKFIAVLALIAIGGFAYSMSSFLAFGVSTYGVILKAADLITIVVPPALPVAMTIGVAFAIQRLQDKEIFCISPPRINVCGHINVMCFDKTGTLTEDGLDVYGTVSMRGGRSGTLETDPLQSSPEMMLVMATCHAVTRVKGKMLGDLLDIKMLEATGWVLEEPEAGAQYDSLVPAVVRPRDASGRESEWGILRRFDFDSRLQRMSVMTRLADSPDVALHAKGSPEIMAELCRPETIPEDFFRVVSSFAERGYRILALARASLGAMPFHKLEKLERAAVERDLEMCGLLVMQNRVKADSAPTIEHLEGAHIRTIMVTGDNPLTAVSVARECGMVSAQAPLFLGQLAPDKTSVEWKATGDAQHSMSSAGLLDSPGDVQLAVSGKAFALLTNPSSAEHKYLVPVLERAPVFARMSPREKRMLVELLAEQLDATVGFCGDGANDCAALKAAHAGVSLSEAEASIAAPLTSRRATVACVLDVIKEGRCSLMASFQAFKFMGLYSLTQFACVIQLYRIGATLGDAQFLYVDLFVILPLAMYMSRTGPADKLTRQRPIARLISAPILSSLVCQTVLMAGLQVASVAMASGEEWFEPYEPQRGKIGVQSYENTILFLFSNFQYIILSVALSIGPPFRQPMYTNFGFSVTVVLLTLISSVLLFDSDQWLLSLMKMLPLPLEFRSRIAALVVGTLIASWVLERFLARPLVCAPQPAARPRGLADTDDDESQPLILESRA